MVVEKTFQNFTSLNPVKRGMTYDITVRSIDWQHQTEEIMRKEHTVKWHETSIEIEWSHTGKRRQ